MAAFSVTPRKPRAISIFHPSGQRVDVEAIQQQEKRTVSPLESPPNVDASRSSGIARKSAAPTTRSSNTVVPVASPDSYKAHTPRKQSNDGRWTPDLYAPAYVPLYLLAINKSYAIYCDCTPLKTTDFDAYIRTFSGSSVLEPAPVPEMPHIQNIPATLSRHTKSLAPINYEHYFNECLLAETYNHSVELARLNLYNVKVDIFKANMQLCSLKIPGLRDGAPRIGLGDIVLIRQIVPSSELPRQGAEWYLQRHGHDGLVAPGFTGQQHHASVWGVNNATELVVLRMNHFIPSLLQCNVIFQVQPSLFVPLWGAVSKVCDGYSSDWPGPDLEAYGRPAGGLKTVTVGSVACCSLVQGIPSCKLSFRWALSSTNDLIRT